MQLYENDQNTAEVRLRRDLRPLLILTKMEIGCRTKNIEIEAKIKNTVDMETLPLEKIPINKGLNRKTHDP